MSVSLNSYIESIKNPNGRFRTLEGIYAVPSTDGSSEPIMQMSNISADFEMILDSKSYKLICLIDPSEEQVNHLKEISTFTQLIESKHLSEFIYLEDEMLVFDNYDNVRYINVILQRNPDAKRIDQYVEELTSNDIPIPTNKIIEGIADLGRWMSDNNFSHNKINARNIWITPTLSPILTDYSVAVRKKPTEDIRSLGTIAATLYSVSCEPRFHALLTTKLPNISSGIGRRMSAIVPALSDLMYEYAPTELRELLDKVINSNEDNIPALELCKSISNLAKCPPQEIAPLKNMVENIAHKVSTSKRYYPPTLKERLMKYRIVDEMHDMLIRAFDGEKWCYLDKNGSVVISGDFIDASNFYEGLAVVETTTGYGLINRDGRFIIEPIYDDVEYEQLSNIIFVTKDGKSGVYSRDGKSITGLVYDQMLNASEGLIPVKKNNLFGYINLDGSAAIKLEFEDAFGFRDGVARVEQRGRQYLIDKNGDEIDEISSDRKPLV